MLRIIFQSITLLLLLCIFVCPSFAEERVIRFGHFPNITHAHGLIAHNSSRRGNGWYESRVGKPLRIEWFTYNAGPSAMEALLVGAIDFAYVGPNPAINAFSRTRGEEVRVLAGATFGGSGLVVHNGNTMENPSDFKGKKIATPQLGNTQDVAARAWLKKNGIFVSQAGGESLILPTENADLLPLFKEHKIDAAWTVEPWISRLEMEGNGRLFLEEKDAVTTVLVGSAKMVREDPALTDAILSAHRELSNWITANPDEAQTMIRAELEAETTRSVSADLVRHAWPRMHFSSELHPERFASFVSSAKEVGFLREVGDLKGLFYEKTSH